MRIDAYNAISQIYQISKPKSVSKSASSASFSDSLQISSAAKSYQTAKAAVANSSDVRQDKVAAIKAAMQNGTYNVSAMDLAEKLLSQSATITF